jgi:hypothetical protein
MLSGLPTSLEVATHHAASRQCVNRSRFSLSFSTANNDLRKPAAPSIVEVTGHPIVSIDNEADGPVLKQNNWTIRAF